MRVLFSQANQECGSSGVCLYLGRERLAEVGIGESVEVELPDSGSGCDVEIKCGSYVFKVHIDNHGPQDLEVAWTLGRAAMVLRRNRQEIGSATIS